jgi:hypothetical protein
MPPRKKPNVDPAAFIATAIDAAAEASERYVAARTDLMHRLAAIDDAVVELVQRVFDSTPAEYQRTFVVRYDGDEDEMTLPEFLRWLMERPGGTDGSFTISVHENLYDDGDGEDEEEGDGEAGEGDDDAEEDLGLDDIIALDDGRRDDDEF